MILRNINFLFADPLGFFVNLLYSIPSILIALTLHELAHGLVAYWCGDDTAKRQGRLTANPLKHLDPVGAVMLLLVGFGFARPVPVNPNRFKRRIFNDILVSLAGITMNILLFLLGFGVLLGMFFQGIGDQIIYDFLSVFISYNASIALFNLLPVPPLDGFHVVNDIFFKGRLYVEPRIQQYAMLGILALSFTGILSRILDVGLAGLENFARWMWMGIFGAFGWF